MQSSRRIAMNAALMNGFCHQSTNTFSLLRDIESSLNRYGAEHPGMSPQLEQKCILAISALLDPDSPKIRQKKSVAVVGAGISGLFAGWLLAHAGFHVVVHEKNGSLDGGRCNTFDFEHQGSKHTIAPGAMRIPDEFTKHLIGRLGLPIKQFKNETADSCIIINEGRVLPHIHASRIFNNRLSELWEYELNEIKSQLDSGTNWIDIVQDKKLHKLTTKQYLLSKGWNESNVESWLSQGFGLGGYKCWESAMGGNVAAFEIIRDQLMCYPGCVPDEMIGLRDMIDLPQALYEKGRRAGVEFNFNSTIDFCESADQRIILINDSKQTFHTDYAIDTAPPKPSSGIHLTTSRKKFLLVEHNNSELARFEGKCLMESEVRQKFATFGIGELYIQQVTPNHVIFMGYSWGSEAKACASLSDQLLADQMYLVLSHTFENLVALRQFYIKTWKEAFRMSSIFDEWYPFQGNYDSHFSKGRSIKGIYSAGDWCSPDTGFIRGALAKALHAAVSIINLSQSKPASADHLAANASWAL
ncbi:MAG: L-glutamate oxidase [Chthoniobacteraceae bacterium]|nr:L-glutamate oxidase [Chthoniobacteraceae bacterium]